MNDAPTNTVPAAMQVVNEDTPLIFSARGGNAVSVADVDGGTLTVALSSAEGNSPCRDGRPDLSPGQRYR